MWTFIGTRKTTAEKTGKRSPLAAKFKLLSLEDRTLPSITYSPIDVPNSVDTSVYGINDAGQIVGAYRTSNQLVHGFLLNNGTYTTIDVPGAPNTVAAGINATGQIVGLHDNPALTRNFGFLLSGGTFATIDPPGSTQSSADDINATGQIVGTFKTGGQHGYLYSGGSYTTIDVPGAADTFTSGINDFGTIVGVYVAGGGKHLFRYDSGVITNLDVPGLNPYSASDINNSGQIVGSYGNDRYGYLLDGGSYVTLDIPGSMQTEALGINDAGQIVGTYKDGAGRTHGYIATITLPRVASQVIDNGQAQRSMVRSLTVTFNQVVTVGANAFAVRLNGGAAVPFTPSISVVNGQTVVNLTVTAGGSLADGRYTLTIHASEVTDNLGNQLDGAGNGTPGTDYVATFHRLFGDANGDATVNAFDYSQFRPAFGSTTGQPAYVDWLDIDGDGAINAFDFGHFRDRFGITLP